MCAGSLVETLSLARSATMELRQVSAGSYQWAVAIARPGPTDWFNYYCDRLLQRERQAVGNLMNYCKHEASRMRCKVEAGSPSAMFEMQSPQREVTGNSVPCSCFRVPLWLPYPLCHLQFPTRIVVVVYNLKWSISVISIFSNPKPGSENHGESPLGTSPL